MTVTDTVVIRDYEYVDGRIYDLMLPGFLGATDRVIGLKVFESRTYSRPEEAASLPVAILRPHPDSVHSPYQLTFKVQEIAADQFEWFDIPATGQHVIVFDIARNVYALGIWLRVEKRDLSDNVLDTFDVGEIDNVDTLILSSLRGLSTANPSNPTFGLVWRNCYSVPKGLSLEDLNLRVYKGAPGTEGTEAAQDYLQVGVVAQSYLQILGLDQVNNATSERHPDKLLDASDAVYRPDLGLVIFPNRTPFDSDTTYFDEAARASFPLPERVPNIYDYFSIAEKTGNSQYFITYEHQVQVPR